MAKKPDSSKRERSDSPKKEKSESEFIEKVLSVNRCSKVVKGGRKFSFSALILVGDGKGRVGYGFAKANELTDAIRKGGEAARKNMVVCPMEGTTIPHEITIHWDGATVLLKPAPAGTGVIAGSKVRAILELAGVKDVMAKNLGSTNPINQVKATFEAIDKLSTRAELRQRRGI
ncbi:MAG: 30S ribosomal protein S5 [Parachlamydiaceae bacterium]|nr:30S ribosomal protein S5 [Parachlamydiaceae bacterium]